jgi:anion-transporting  ArsA/GET3 family ATPase
MLDAKATFDDLVRRHAQTPDQAEIILSNRIYRNLTMALSGTQEYMAMEKLYELVEEGGFDVVVVDTPPTRNALDFLDAPRRLTRFLGHRLFQLLLMPTRAYFRAVSMATQALLRTLSKVAGADIVNDAVRFFQAFEGMEEGFRLRAERMRQLLERTTTSFVLVTSPRPDAVDEATWFAHKLGELNLAVDGLIVNRVHPAYPVAELFPDVPPSSPLAALEENLRAYQAASERDELAIEALAAELAPSAVARVPMLAADVHDLDGLTQVADHLFGVGDGPDASGHRGAGPGEAVTTP